ncbi:hypothetical protein AbraIFM66950_002437 [Aspergillus brasiliensis]|nr:hypothetical protein AbraIFM66950_002437 [Aspergillus brasiliensis]
MKYFTNPLRWHTWSSLWVFISEIFMKARFFQIQRTESAELAVEEHGGSEDVKTHAQHNAQWPEETPHTVVDHLHTDQQSCNRKVVHVMQPPNCISMGYSGYICKADQDTIIKRPKQIPGDEPYNLMYHDMTITERQIYERLGNHIGIIPYLGVYDESTGAIKLAYAEQGDLEAYIESHDAPPEAVRTSWIQSIVETFWYIYSSKVLLQDVKPNNILVHNGSLKVTDFGNAAVFALDADMEAICRKDPLSRVDILGIGCIIYSIAAWRAFWYDYFEDQRWPMQEDLPETSGLLCEDVIRKCWSDSYDTIQALYEDFNSFTAANMSGG